MIEMFNEYVKTLYAADKNMYGLITLGIMAGMGISLGLITELVLRLLGVKGGAH
ncbi:MAG: MFS transporter [Peptococcaceae bacterium]|nr:MFS transporter [Peptococcaceae bacterium]